MLHDMVTFRDYVVEINIGSQEGNPFSAVSFECQIATNRNYRQIASTVNRRRPSNQSFFLNVKLHNLWISPKASSWQIKKQERKIKIEERQMATRCLSQHRVLGNYYHIRRLNFIVDASYLFSILCHCSTFVGARKLLQIFYRQAT